MHFIQTNYLPQNTRIDLANTRIYGTTCEDIHFKEIIAANKKSLDGEYITNLLYVLMENESIEDAKDIYASISLHEERSGDYESYYPCVITSEELLDAKVCLKYLLEKVIEHLSSDNSYFLFDKERKEKIKILGNEQNIVTRMLALCRIEH